MEQQQQQPKQRIIRSPPILAVGVEQPLVPPAPRPQVALAPVHPPLRGLLHAHQRARRDGPGRVRRLRPPRPLEAETEGHSLLSSFPGTHHHHTINPNHNSLHRPVVNDREGPKGQDGKMICSQ